MLISAGWTFWLWVVGLGALGFIAVVILNALLSNIPGIGRYLSLDSDERNAPGSSKAVSTIFWPVRFVLGWAVLIVPGFLVGSLFFESIPVYEIETRNGEMAGYEGEGASLAYAEGTMLGLAGLLSDIGLAGDVPDPGLLEGAHSETDILLINASNSGIHHVRIYYATEALRAAASARGNNLDDMLNERTLESMLVVVPGDMMRLTSSLGNVYWGCADEPPDVLQTTASEGYVVWFTLQEWYLCPAVEES